MNLFGDKKKFEEISNDIIENPFSSECISDVYLRAFKLGNKTRVRGCVVFTKGNTKGKQEFQADTLSELFLKIYNFCNTLK